MKRARLVSSWQSLGKYCLSFWYYMYGRDTDKLWIARIDEKAREEELFYTTKNPSKTWKFKRRVFETGKKFKVYISFNCLV